MKLNGSEPQSTGARARRGESDVKPLVSRWTGQCAVLPFPSRVRTGGARCGLHLAGWCFALQALRLLFMGKAPTRVSSNCRRILSSKVLQREHRKPPFYTVTQPN